MSFGVAAALLLMLQTTKSGEGALARPKFERRPAASAVAPDDRIPTRRRQPAAMEDDRYNTGAAADDASLDSAADNSAVREVPVESGRSAPRAIRPRSTLDSGDGMAPVGVVNQRMRPPEIIAQSLAQVPFNELRGRPTTLRQALSASTDRPQQLKIAVGYWKVCGAQCNYYFAIEQRNRFLDTTKMLYGEDLPAPAEGIRDSYRASARDAELNVIKLQHALAILMNMPVDGELPLASDRLHSGGYNLSLDPARMQQQPAWVLYTDKSLEARRIVMDEHAKAIASAIDATDATAENFRENKVGLTAYSASIDLLARERKALVTAVRKYNEEIATYVFNVAPAGSSASDLVGLLLSSPVDRSDVPKRKADSFRDSRTSVDEPSERTFRGDEAPSARPRQSIVQGVRKVVANDPSEQAAEHDVLRPPSGVEAPLYKSIVGDEVNLRAQKLSDLVHWQRSEPPFESKAITLKECLTKAPPANRRVAVAAFWKSREKASLHQMLADQAEQLVQLNPHAVRAHSAGDSVVLRLQAARNAAVAELGEARLAMLQANYELTAAMSAPAHAPWLVAATPPHGGRYRTDIATPNGAPQPAELKYLSDTVYVAHRRMRFAADALINADASRAGYVEEAAQGRPTVDSAMSWTLRAGADGRNFLRSQTAYNLEILDYVLASLPPETPVDQLVAALVVPRHETGS